MIKTKKRIFSLLLAVCLLAGLLPASALAAGNGDYQITTDIEDQKFVVGQKAEFTVTTNVAEGADTKTVLGHFEVKGSDGNSVIPSGAYEANYWDVTRGDWLPLTGSTFGPGTGFPMTDGAASRFQVTFRQSGTYTAEFYIQEVSGTDKLCTTGAFEITVYNAVSVNVAGEAGGTAVLTTTAETEGKSELTVENGTDVTLKVNAADGYQIASVTVNKVDEPIADNEKEAFSKELTITENTDIEVSFVKMYTVHVTWDSELGTVEADPALGKGGTVTVKNGDRVSIKATPKEIIRLRRL